MKKRNNINQNKAYILLTIVVLIPAVILALAGKSSKSEEPVATEMEVGMEKATFAAGCFWGVESAFRQLDGVRKTTVGYTGGHTKNPTYRDVCSDRTGHAEAVEVVFDSAVITYRQLVDTFFSIHNPTTPNRQGPDVGSQYRSAIFYHSEEQRDQAEAAKKKLNRSGEYPVPVVTEVTAATTFYPAEKYHQQYYEKKGVVPACHLVK